MTLQEAKQRVLERPFAYPTAATMIEKDVARAMLADHVFRPCQREAMPEMAARNRIDRSDVIKWMRGRGDVDAVRLSAAGLGHDVEKSRAILSDLYTSGRIDRVSDARRKAIYRLD